VFSIAVISLITLIGLVLVQVLAAVSVRIETETAADAAALAAVGAAVDGRSPRAAAMLIANANGATLDRCRCPGYDARSFTATVIVTRDFRLPLLGDRRISVERSAEYSIDP
jgi:hypothetical protein